MWVYITSPAKRAEYKAKRGRAVNLPKEEAEKLIGRGQARPKAEAAAKDTADAERATQTEPEKRG